VTLTPIVLLLNAANTLIMGKRNSKALGLYQMQYPKSMTLCSLSFSKWGCNHFAFSFANKGCQYVDYGKQQANSFAIDLLTRPKIVDALLTLIFRMRL